ncbi:unnamed protein product, partial [Nesidiocoris tenuis]
MILRATLRRISIIIAYAHEGMTFLRRKHLFIGWAGGISRGISISARIYQSKARVRERTLQKRENAPR